MISDPTTAVVYPPGTTGSGSVSIDVPSDGLLYRLSTTKYDEDPAGCFAGPVNKPTFGPNNNGYPVYFNNIPIPVSLNLSAPGWVNLPQYEIAWAYFLVMKQKNVGGQWLDVEGAYMQAQAQKP